MRFWSYHPGFVNGNKDEDPPNELFSLYLKRTGSVILISCDPSMRLLGALESLGTGSIADCGMYQAFASMLQHLSVAARIVIG
jgi:hypothetical protein